MYVRGTGGIKVMKKKDGNGSGTVFSFNVSGSPQKHTKQPDSKTHETTFTTKSANKVSSGTLKHK